MTNAKALHWKDFRETNSSPCKICKFLNVICPCNSEIWFKLKDKFSGLCIELNPAGNTRGGWWIRSCKHLQKQISMINHQKIFIFRETKLNMISLPILKASKGQRSHPGIVTSMDRVRARNKFLVVRIENGVSRNKVKPTNEINLK